jgi:hypothetical protein
VGLLVTMTGYSAAFALVAVGMVPALALARRAAQPEPENVVDVDPVLVPVAA